MFGAGTAWVLLAVSERLADPVAGAAFVCRHPAGGRFGQMLSLGNGGSAVAWALGVVGREGLGAGELDAMIRSSPPGAEGLMFEPFLASAGTGLERPGGRLTGIRLGHEPRHLLRAVVEGLACELARHVGMLGAAGIAVDRLIMCGRAAGSGVTPQIVADVTGVAIDCTAEGEIGALGAAVIARRLVDRERSLAELSAAMAPPLRRVRPGRDAAAYRDLRARYAASLARR
jgi:sugar (pentulose or hexulose) kinase